MPTVTFSDYLKRTWTSSVSSRPSRSRARSIPSLLDVASDCADLPECFDLFIQFSTITRDSFSIDDTSFCSWIDGHGESGNSRWLLSETSRFDVSLPSIPTGWCWRSDGRKSKANLQLQPLSTSSSKETERLSQRHESGLSRQWC